MSLEEAVANWKEEEGHALVNAAAAKTVADMDRIVLRLDAAVKDVALAAANWPTEAEMDSCPIGATAAAEIERRFGAVPAMGSEGGPVGP